MDKFLSGLNAFAKVFPVIIRKTSSIVTATAKLVSQIASSLKGT